jgi:hypothetical protein
VRLLARLRPAEWVLVAFGAYAVARMLGAGRLGLAVETVPRTDLLAAFLAVVTLRLGVEYRSKPWPPELDERHQLHKRMLPMFLGMGAFGLWIGIRSSGALDEVGGGMLAPLVVTIHAWAFSILASVVVPAFLWLAYGLHVRAHGRLRPSFVWETGGVVLRALREWAPILALIWAYGWMGRILAAPLFADRDAALARLDAALFFGRDPLVLLERTIGPGLSEWLAGCYVSYAFLFPVVLGAVYAKGDLRAFREVTFAASFALAVGYVTYTLVPAQGPLFTQRFSVSLDLYYMAWIKEQLMDRTRVPRDCFPSLHTCMSLVFLWGAWRHVRPLGWVLAPFALSIPFACVYLRYHYVVDVLAGCALFALATTLAKRLHRAPVGLAVDLPPAASGEAVPVGDADQ